MFRSLRSLNWVAPHTKDADAIAFRWKDSTGSYKIGIFDGGLHAYGEKLKEHLEQYYFADGQPKVIDCVICSHSDSDHASGLQSILKNFQVKALYMNRPWRHINDVWGNIIDDRITKNSLEKKLKESYEYIAVLEEIADEKSIPIYNAFQGTCIEGCLYVMSPTKDFYKNLLIESSKTPLDSKVSLIEGALTKGLKCIRSFWESWSDENLKETVTTSEENEMSIILLGDMQEEKFLLTGDAGIRALEIAISHASSMGTSMVDDISFYQIPHHGGRHNVAPSILNSLVGSILPEGERINKTAFVSAGKNSDHPLQMVVNAFIRRGVSVYTTNGQTIRHSRNMPDRSGWSKLSRLEFSNQVESWSD